MRPKLLVTAKSRLTTRPKIVRKDWGREEWIINNDLYCGKFLVLDQGWQCSLHHHKIKHETFFVQEGRVFLELGDEVLILTPLDCVEIPIGVQHRFGGMEPSVIIEFSTHHEDSDSYRVPGEESRYNRMLLEAAE
jgi:mannose-6-phosphate isomerase-like protein (cupin superfamily)